MSKFDEEAIAGLRELLGERFKVMVRAYLDDCTQRLEKMKAALAEHNLPAVRQEAHGIKGSCRNVGVLVLGDICAEIEKQAHAGDATDLQQKIAAAEQEFAAVSIKFKDYLT